jgi:membrane protein YqaA with SNARE-associated domain
MADSSPTDPAAEERELRLLRHERLSLRAWFLPFFAMLAVLAAVYFLSGKGSTTAHVALLFGYLSLACTFLPLPTAWLVMWMGAPAEGGGCGLHPLLVATVGAMGTAVGNLNDYYLLTFLYQYKPVQKIRAYGWYRKVAAWYNRAPFGTLAAASFLPIPIDFVRLLAISEGYSRTKFVLGSLVGRWPRYFLFALAADQFKLGWQWIVGIAGATIVLGLWRGLPPLARKLADWLRRRRAARKEA